MGKRRGIKNKSYLIKDIAREFSQYSNAPLKDQYLLIKAVLDSLKALVLKADAYDRIILCGFGTFDIRALKPAKGRLRNFKTNQFIDTFKGGLKIHFVPSAKVRKALKNKSTKRLNDDISRS